MGMILMIQTTLDRRTKYLQQDLSDDQAFDGFSLEVGF